jgi:two-component system OmpR family sensor kinase
VADELDGSEGPEGPDRPDGPHTSDGKVSLLHRARTLPARTPLRVRLVVALLALVAVALAVTGVTATTQLRGYLVTQVDQDLHGQPPPYLSGRAGATDDAQFGSGRPEWLRLTSVQGAALGDDVESGPSAPPPKLTRAEIVAAGDEPFTVPATSGDSSWRVIVQQADIRGYGPGIAVRAISLTDVDGTVHRLILIELLVGIVVLVLLGGAGYVVVRRSLRPLVEVEHTAAAIADGDLSRRVPETDPRTEVGRLSRALNGMLAQIESAFRAREASEVAARASEDKMRRFVADASHELRTPLTSIRGFAELYRQGAAAEPEDIARVMRRVEDSAAQMGVLVDDLLLLARLDQQRPLERAPVDLVAVAADAVQDARAMAPDREITLEVTAGEAAVVLGDELRLRQVLANLVSNALSHTPDGSQVDVEVEAAPQARQVRLSVRDRGPGLAASDASRIFERFFRADTSRTRSAGGTGLGLSIVAALVHAHGGQVGVDTAPGHGATFWVRLPLDRDDGLPPAGPNGRTREDTQVDHRSVTGS